MDACWERRGRASCALTPSNSLIRTVACIGSGPYLKIPPSLTRAVRITPRAVRAKEKGGTHLQTFEGATLGRFGAVELVDVLTA